MSNEEFILQNRDADIRALALKAQPQGIDLTWCLQQIEGLQLAQRKLPKWASTQGIWFPARISLEQCSSEQTALYKQGILKRLLPEDAERHKIIDLTGGFGIDFSYISPIFKEACYCEQNPKLCEIAKHNFEVLGMHETKIENVEICQEWLSRAEPNPTVFYIDPARRDGIGRKTVAIADCTPNLERIQDKLLENARFLLIKLSPMLDIQQALRCLRHVGEIHAVSVQGECKELLFVMGKEFDCAPKFFCTNVTKEAKSIEFTEKERGVCPEIIPAEEELHDMLLFEPNASLLKANCQDAFAQKIGLRKIHPASNLYIARKETRLPDKNDGRLFEITGCSDFKKQNLKKMLSDISQANLTIRNFPNTVAELRKKWKLKEGGEIYLFATTRADNSHALIRCRKYLFIIFAFLFQSNVWAQKDTIPEKVDTLNEVTVRPYKINTEDLISPLTRSSAKLNNKKSLLPDNVNDMITHPFAFKERKKERRHKKNKKILQQFDARKTENDLLREALEREGLLDDLEKKRAN